MKRLIQLLFISLFPVVTFSQTFEEKKEITKDYNIEILEELANSFQLKAELEKAEALTLAKQNGWRVKYEEDGQFFELMKVSKEGNPIYYTTFNVNAAKSTRANTLHNGGILGLNVEGQNMEAHVWDEGLARTSHQEYDGAGGSNRFSIGDGTTSLSWHSAHVTGTIIASGYVSSAKGMAPQAAAVGYDWFNDQSEATSAASGGMLLSNHSYGWDATTIPDWYFGAYNYESRNWDIILHNAPYYLMVVSAGNDGNDNSSNGNPLDGNIYYDKLSGQATAKNNMVVANANDANINGNGDLISVSINSGSSEGPCDDYRIKPDITGNGTSLYSTFESYNSEYGYLTGTSMSSPNVTGTLLLLQQHYNNINAGFMRAATLKGLALHTADDAGPTGPDAVWGWGLLNGKEAANAITNNGVQSTISELILNQGGTYTVNINSDGINDLIASISWTDPAGTANTGSPNNTTPALVNDLDIRVTKGGSTYYPYRLTSITTNGTGDNDVDPFEKVIIGSASGTYTITVTHKGSLSGGSQNFSLIVTGGTTTSAAPVADFEADNLTPGVGETVNFTDLSTNIPTSWLWSFSPSTITYVGGTDASSQNPQVQFNSTGSYTVELTATNGTGSDSETKTNYIDVSLYCDASGGFNFMYISNVLLETINNSSGQDYYMDYTGISTDIALNQSYDIEISNGGSYQPSDLGIWIDYNQDGDFGDTGENIVCDIDNWGQGTFNFTVPGTAFTGTTRMRIRIKYTGSDCGDPCGTTTYGEVEDYSVNVILGADPGLWNGNSSNDWNITSNWDENNIPNSGTDVLIPSTPSGGNFPETNTGAGAVCNDLTIEAGAHLYIPSNNTLTVNGTLTNNAGASGLVIKSDSPSEFGSLIHSNSGVQATVEQFVEFDGVAGWQWHLVSSPISDATINTYYDIFLYQYHEDGNAPGGGYWENLVNPVTIPMNVGQGYNITGSNTWIGTTTVTYATGAAGALNSSDVTITNFTMDDPDINFRGFELVGNPYPCAIDWNNHVDWTRTGLSGWAVILDNGTYRGWHSDGAPWQGGTSIIPSTQGFFVRATSLPASFTIPTSQRVHDDQAFYKGKEDFIYPIVRLEAEFNNHSDESVVVFHPEGSTGFDDYYDLSKFTNAEGLPNLYSVSEGFNYAFSFLPKEYVDMIVPVYFEMGIPGICNIEATEINNIGDEINVYLEDIKEGIVTNLSTDPIYEFDHNLDNAPHRFNLHFKESWYGVEDHTAGNINIYSAEDFVYIVTPEMESGEVFIFDMLGQEIESKRINESNITKIRITSGTAYYLVKFQSDKFLVTKKVFIK